MTFYVHVHACISNLRKLPICCDTCSTPNSFCQIISRQKKTSALGPQEISIEQDGAQSPRTHDHCGTVQLRDVHSLDTEEYVQCADCFCEWTRTRTVPHTHPRMYTSNILLHSAPLFESAPDSRSLGSCISHSAYGTPTRPTS